MDVSAGQLLKIRITRDATAIFDGEMLFSRSFSDVSVNQPLVFVNNIGEIALARNRGNFAETHGIKAGPEWSIEISPAEERD